VRIIATTGADNGSKATWQTRDELSFGRTKCKTAGWKEGEGPTRWAE